MCHSIYTCTKRTRLLSDLLFSAHSSPLRVARASCRICSRHKGVKARVSSQRRGAMGSQTLSWALRSAPARAQHAARSSRTRAGRIFAPAQPAVYYRDSYNARAHQPRTGSAFSIFKITHTHALARVGQPLLFFYYLHLWTLCVLARLILYFAYWRLFYKCVLIKSGQRRVTLFSIWWRFYSFMRRIFLFSQARLVFYLWVSACVIFQIRRTPVGFSKWKACRYIGLECKYL